MTEGTMARTTALMVMLTASFAVVPCLSHASVNERQLSRIEGRSWRAMSERKWLATAHELAQQAENERDPALLVRVYAQVGRAAENHNHPCAPYFQRFDGYTMNWYWFLAADHVSRDPALLGLVPDPDVRDSITYYVGLIQAGQISPPGV